MLAAMLRAAAWLTMAAAALAQTPEAPRSEAASLKVALGLDRDHALAPLVCSCP
jgi:hypothetical protein